jgi:hypothetical protein
VAAGRKPDVLKNLQPSCGECNAFAPDPEATEGVLWGFCCEGPGTPLVDEEGTVQTHQPTKAAHEWCRRFQPKQ